MNKLRNPALPIEGAQHQEDLTIRPAVLIMPPWERIDTHDGKDAAWSNILSRHPR
ncbi:MAG: hypothetical protein ACREXR_12065 [Gammaproteobacteria bacterium]